MNLDDFRCMRRGVQLSILKREDAALLEPVNLRNGRKKNALLLLHGFSSTPAVYRHLIASISDYDAIIVPVLPGHAKSLEVFSRMKAAELMPFVEKVCADLIGEFQHVDVMGLSLGGLLACHLATCFKLRHLYLLAPALDLHLAMNKIIKLAKGLHWLGFRQLRNEAGNLYAPNTCDIVYRQLPLLSLIEVLSFISEFKFKLPSCPTDLFLGRHDEVVASQLVANRFSNNTTIHWLDNSAHVLPIDGDSETILLRVQQNLALYQGTSYAQKISD